MIKTFKPIGIVAGVEPLTKKVMESTTSLKIISRCGVGLDSVDLESAEKLGITVVNTPQAPVPAVAELALALMLTWLRRTSYADQQMKQGKWIKSKGSLLAGKKIGIIGCGRIGSYLARLLIAFGCTVYGFDSCIKSQAPFEMVDFDTLLHDSDIVSLHVPLTDQTRNMMDKKNLEKMKPTSLIVNTSRGGLIDEDALYSAILHGVLAGAALDVFSEEPYTGNLTELGDQVVLSPHQASNTLESRDIMEMEAVKNLILEISNKGII